jgi:CheY-like chemotaxis protein
MAERVFFETTVNEFTVTEVTENAARARSAAHPATEEEVMKRKLVLLVDDDRDLVAGVKVYLEARGYEVATAHSGVEARERLDERLPDLVVLDIMMDYDTDGFNVAFKLREDPETAGIPVIIMSGFTKELDTKTHVFEPMMYREWPAAKFLEKPVKLADLAATIGELLADEQPAADEKPAAKGV